MMLGDGTQAFLRGSQMLYPLSDASSPRSYSFLTKCAWAPFMIEVCFSPVALGSFIHPECFCVPTGY